MKHLKKNIISNISSNNNIVSKNTKNYADFGQKKKPTGLTGKKNRLFKSLGIGAMAVFMGILTVLGTACTPTQTNTNLENGSLASGNKTEAVKPAPSPLGLDPKNDPIIYTTESGLEIKYGGLDLEGTLSSGNLKGYPYFTMGTYSGKAVNWVIIGRATDVTQNVQIDGTESVLFSNWKESSMRNLSNYFMNNIFETDSPAGNAINSITASKSYVVDDKIITTSLTSLVSDSNITSGCVLAWCESSFLIEGAINSSNSSNYQGSKLQTLHQNLYDTGLSLSDSQKVLIQPQSFTNTYYSSSSSSSSNQSLFPLATRGEKFTVSTYLTTNTLRANGLAVLSRSGHYDLNGSYHMWQCIDTDGSIDCTTYNVSTNRYFRPAMVVSIN